MKIYTSKGIIFKSLKYSETSIICDIYTREKGLRSFIISGVRTSKAGSKAAIYQHLNLVELISYDQDADKLARIKEIRLDHHYQYINTQVVIFFYCHFYARGESKCSERKGSKYRVVDFLENWLIYLDSGPSAPSMHSPIVYVAIKQ